MKRSISFARNGWATFCSAVALPTLAAFGQKFTVLEFPPEVTSNATGISRDGAVVVGYAGYNSNIAFRGNREGMMAALGTIVGGSNSYAAAVNDNGSVVVGYGNNAAGYVTPWKWTDDSGVQALPVLSSAVGGVATCIAGDGQLIGGWVGIPGVGDRAALWPAAGGVLDLGLLPGYARSYCDAISGNGQVIWGYCRQWPQTLGVPFRWTVAGGMVDMSGVLGTYARVFRVNADGTVLAGRSQVGASYVAFRWSEPGGKVELGALPGDNSQNAFGLSDDGSVVVGSSSVAEGIGPYRAFMWTPALGTVDLNAYLPTLGINLEGWTLTEARGLSADGRIITGTGQHLGLTQSWVAVLGMASCYPNCDASTAAPRLNVSDYICFMNKYAAGDSYANCDQSTLAPTLNVADFICFMNEYAEGCP